MRVETQMWAAGVEKSTFVNANRAVGDQQPVSRSKRCVDSL